MFALQKYVEDHIDGNGVRLDLTLVQNESEEIESTVGPVLVRKVPERYIGDVQEVCWSFFWEPEEGE